MRPDAYGIMTACGSPHLARKAEQVHQGLRDIGSSKRTCPLCSDMGNCDFLYHKTHGILSGRQQKNAGMQWKE